MIRVTREQLLISERGLSVLSGEKLPISVAFKLNGIIKQVAEKLQETEQVRQDIIAKYADKDEAGETIVDKETNMVHFSDENRDKFQSEMETLFSDICEISGDPIDVELLGDVSISLADLSTIEPFLK